MKTNSLLKVLLRRRHHLRLAMSTNDNNNQTLIQLYGRVVSLRPHVQDIESTDRLIQAMSQHMTTSLPLPDPLLIEDPVIHWQQLVPDLVAYGRVATHLRQSINDYIWDTLLVSPQDGPSNGSGGHQLTASHDQQSSSLSGDSFDQLVANRGSPDAGVSPEPVVRHFNTLALDSDGQEIRSDSDEQ